VKPGPFTFRWPAPPGEVWAPDAFDRALGQRLPLRITGHMIGDLELTAVEVIEDGHAVLITLDPVTS